MKTVTIAGREIGDGRPAFIIAEAGINHNGDIGLAKKLIAAAKECGADAVKFQSFQADKICDAELTETKHVQGITGGSNSSCEMYRNLELSDDNHRALFQYAAELGIICFTSVFDEERIDFLHQLGTPAFKISSGDITYLPLIRKAASTGRPVMISSGMSTLDEVAAAVRCCRETGNGNIVLFHCSSLYPPPDVDINLNAMLTMRESFPLPVGYSDHTRGTAVSIAAVTMGASAVEKHFTLDTDMPGPDHSLSLDPEGLKNMVADIRLVEKAKGSFIKRPSPDERKALFDGRRSIVAAADIPAGSIITREQLRIIKPAKGLSPAFLDVIVGCRAPKNIAKHQPITRESIEGLEGQCEIAVFARH